MLKIHENEHIPGELQCNCIDCNYEYGQRAVFLKFLNGQLYPRMVH